jgi:transcriptional regulator with XRE-family HTH domain
MTRERQNAQRCLCGATLARDNRTGRCAACNAKARQDPVAPPEASAQFWRHPAMREALARRHMGQLIRAFRTHPDHGRHVISQETAASWAGITQAQLSRIENGAPIVHLDRLIQWAKTLRIPPEHLWFTMPNEGTAEGDPDDVKRNEFLRLGRDLAVGGVAARLFAGLPVSQVSAQDCAQWLAWELWERKATRLHGTELPAAIAKYLEPRTSIPGAVGPILRDAEGFYTFAHPSFIDFHVAQRIFGEIAVGDSKLFATAQTSHDTDMVIREFVTRDARTADALRRWMTRAPSPVLRVNSAGVLAKVGGGIEDEVVRALKGDVDTRHLYLTAVASRVLELPWARAADLAAAVDRGSAAGLWQQSREQAARVAVQLAAEVSNPRDGAARWCSVLMLGQVRDATPDIADAALHAALRQERGAETIRSIGALLSGDNPLSY